MDTCIFIRSLDDFQNIHDLTDKEVHTVVYGDYGCVNHLRSAEEIIEFKNLLFLENIKLHYVSPKVTLYTIDEEELRVLKLLNEDISVSINDYGLLFRLKDKIKSEHDLYLGRLLSKSIADWVWSDIFFEKEKDATITYLSQNSFNHSVKLEYFRDLGVKGIEVNIHKKGEISYQSIQEQGFHIMGYVDKSIAAVSRACPYLKLHNKKENITCSSLCKKSLFLKPSQSEQGDVYPVLQLFGNVLYSTKVEDICWNGYDKLVYTAF